MFEVSCTSEEKVVLTLAPTTKGGVAVLPIAPPTVTVESGDGTAAVIDQSTVEVSSGSLVGDTVFTVAADFDPNGDGLVEHLAEQIVLHVGEAQVVGWGMSAASPVLK
jgi:hypothetical protein